MTERTLAEQVAAVEHALSAVPHAFGGALALAYYAEPRATIDIDLNVFVPADQFARVAAPLIRLGVAMAAPELAERARADGQVRVWWDRTPIDLFFAYDSFHDAAASARRSVPFGAGRISILGVEHLIVCKVIFDRPRDWVDIDAVVSAGATIDVAEVLRWVGRIAGDRDRRYTRAAAVLTRR